MNAERRHRADLHRADRRVRQREPAGPATNRFEVLRGEVAESTAFAIQAIVAAALAGTGRTGPVPPAS